MTFRTFKIALMASVFVGATAPAALAQQTDADAKVKAEHAMPYNMADNTWITMSGTVSSPTESTFLLNYGANQIIVELDSWESQGAAMELAEGHEVTVTGRIDNDLLETATIEASAVVDDQTGEHYFANAADEEDLTEWFAARAAAEGATTLRGAVKMVNAEQDGFLLDNGVIEVKVDVSELDDNPLDMIGTPQIKEGDIVTVSGDVEKDLFKERELQARTLVLMTPHDVKLERSAGVKSDTQVAGSAPQNDEEAAFAVTAAGGVAINEELPEEVQMATEKEGYTTEDLAKAELAALRSAPPLNPS